MKRFIAVGALLLVGCSSMQYYAQAVSGHFDVLQRARAIDEVLAADDTSHALRTKLEQVRVIRSFAVKELALPDNGSYRSYADVERPFVVWNVFAAPEFSLQPHKSCFLFVGCVSYRGYYNLAEAQHEAARLKRDGYDVFVGGVPAYSTLGWFDDPVLNTFVSYPDAELARLMFHELAHQVAFAQGDTQFNESFAVAVEREGLRRWLERHGSDMDRDAYAVRRERRTAFIELVQRYRDKLAVWYAASVNKDEMRAGKQHIIENMKTDYVALKESWNGYTGYDRWFAQGVNNAQFASFAAYSRHVPAFEALLEREGGDMPRFYAAVQALAAQDKPLRETRLAELEASRTPRAVAAAVTAGAIAQQ
ncbi:MAG TPA: aminopeptidase [Burkholderiales bacterium]